MSLDTTTIIVPSADQIRQQWLDDFRLAALEQGIESPPVQPNTDEYLRATGMGQLGAQAYAAIAFHDRATDVDKADEEQLEEMRKQLGLPVAASTPASSSGIEIRVFGGGTVALTSGLLAVMPNGTHARLSRDYAAAANEDLIEFTTVEVGRAQNVQTGKLRWVQAPLNVGAEMTITTPFAGGVDNESAGRKRKRIKNRLRNQPGGGNWAQHVEVALNTSAALSGAYVYSACGAAGQVKVIVANPIDTDLDVYTRAVDSLTVTALQNALDTEMPDGAFRNTQSTAFQLSDHAMQIKIPTAKATGWVNGTPWPPLVEDDGGRVRVLSVISPNIFTVSAETSVEPVEGITKIVIWDDETASFTEARIDGVSGSAGSRQITTDIAIASISPGQFVSPAAYNAETYGKSFVAMMDGLGPGEQTDNASLLADCYRKPVIGPENPSDVTSRSLDQITDESPEIEDAEWSYNSATTPDIPATLADPAKTLTIRHFGFYPV